MARRYSTYSALAGARGKGGLVASFHKPKAAHVSGMQPEQICQEPSRNRDVKLSDSCSLRLQLFVVCTYVHTWPLAIALGASIQSIITECSD
jgi:hypothetical protein